MVAAALLTAACLVPHSDAAPIGDATVIAIDQEGKSFRCLWGKAKEWTFHTTDKTVFLVGSKKGSFSDLSVGQRVNISFHIDRRGRTADMVVIVKK